MALQCVNMAREPVTNKYSVVLIKKLRLSVTKQTFKQKTTLQGSESAESHWYLIGVAYYFTNYNYTLYMDI